MTPPNASSLKAESLKTGWIDVIKHRWLYLGISLVLLLPGLWFMSESMLNSPLHTPVKLGIDFVGGTLLEYSVPKALKPEELAKITAVFEEQGHPGAVVQLQESRVVPTTLSKDTQAASKDQSVVSIRVKDLKTQELPAITQRLSQTYGGMTLLQKNMVGPTLARELLQNGLLALLCAYLLIIGYLTYRFQLDFALCAIIALLHDTLFVLGVFSGLGLFFNVEVDSLFITAILTVIGFSVHDTIVVFDRLRENEKNLHMQKLPFGHIANLSLNQTLRRSINTSLTALLTLLALYFFGGDTTRNFVLVMILGILAGTYSSIFNASVLLAWWRQRQHASV
jgi:preprotein translocase subunit SecF